MYHATVAVATRKGGRAPRESARRIDARLRISYSLGVKCHGLLAGWHRLVAWSLPGAHEIMRHGRQGRWRSGVKMNKGYIYFAMAFSLVVEFLNIRVRRLRSDKTVASQTAEV